MRRLNAMLLETGTWLASQFDAKVDPPGWRTHLNETGAGDTGEVAEGLTLQIYAELLRAEEEIGLALPPQLLLAIPKHIDRLVGRPLNYANSVYINARTFTNYDGKLTTRTITTSFLWYPWAIEVTSRWYGRLERTGGSAENKVRSRRALGFLIIDLGGSSLPAAATMDTPTFVASETLYALAGVPREIPQPVSTTRGSLFRP
jgi:hypothetical protein